MNRFVWPRHDGDAPRQDRDDPGPGLTAVPTVILQRHGARVLDPSQAEAVPGVSPPLSTVYRARTLLVPGDLLADPAFAAAADAALRPVGMRLVVPERAPGAAQEAKAERVAQTLRRLPRPAVLAPAIPADGTAARPVVVDAWVALQALRAAASARREPVRARDAELAPAGPGEQASDEPALSKPDVGRITLEHLLVSSAIGGAPITHSGGVAGGSAGVGADPSSTDSYLFSGGDARIPVAVCLDTPVRAKAQECGEWYGRRAVVAVADTGVRAHGWLDVSANPAGGYLTETDGFVAVDPAMQDVIYDTGKLTAAAGDRPRQLIRYSWDTPVSTEPLVGELADATGHGAFIAGIVRQVAPNAQVLSIRVSHSDGIVNEGDLVCALGQLAARVAAAVDGDLAGMVDVLSLSLGYFSESAADVAYSSGLWQVLDLLLDLGVAVVAAAGNYATTRRFYPAAFSREPAPDGRPQLISVGALNPNGSPALFSDSGPWVTAYAPGALLVSVFPEDVNGSRDPEIWDHGRQSLKPDDFSGGFALWSGTSFSAPLLAAHLAKSLLAGAAGPGGGLRLNTPGPAAARHRAAAALAALRGEG